MSTNYILPTADACLVLFCTPSHQVYQRRGSLRAQAVALFVLTFASLRLGGESGRWGEWEMGELGEWGSGREGDGDMGELGELGELGKFSFFSEY
ncbi:MAG: hypothetical protein LH628_15215 [Microcoleus sp. CAN_BIN18]|nr:hypothetical protein [Microcoleus sp. CAN_BIN18]